MSDLSLKHQFPHIILGPSQNHSPDSFSNFKGCVNSGIVRAIIPPCVIGSVGPPVPPNHCCSCVLTSESCCVYRFIYNLVQAISLNWKSQVYSL